MEEPFARKSKTRKVRGVWRLVSAHVKVEGTLIGRHGKFKGQANSINT